MRNNKYSEDITLFFERDTRFHSRIEIKQAKKYNYKLNGVKISNLDLMHKKEAQKSSISKKFTDQTINSFNITMEGIYA